MSSADKKKKLEAGLQDLFSKLKDQVIKSQEPPPTEDPEPETAPPPAEPLPGVPPLAEPAQEIASASEQAVVEAGDLAAAEPLAPTPHRKTAASPQVIPEAEEQVVVFTLANGHYAVDVNIVQGIVEMQDIIAVPNAPPFVIGVINMRGTVLPVVDLRRRFGLPAAESTKNSRIMVVEVNNMAMGMAVDAVTAVSRVSPAAIEPLSPLIKTVDSAFVTGIATVDERLIILLDIGSMFYPSELSRLG